MSALRPYQYVALNAMLQSAAATSPFREALRQAEAVGRALRGPPSGEVRARVLAVADAIEGAPGRFDMASYFSGDDPTDCGTTACIAGWAVMTFRPGEVRALVALLDEWSGSTALALAACEVLGIEPFSTDQSAMFNTYTVVESGVERDATAEDAVRVLRHYANTGEIDWRTAS